MKYSHLITTAETAQKKTEQKKQKEKNRINNYCVDIDDVVAETTANYYTKCVNYGYRYDPKVMFDYQSTLHKFEDYYNKLSLMEKEIFMSYLNGASEQNRTAVSALARPHTNRCTTPALYTFSD